MSSDPRPSFKERLLLFVARWLAPLLIRAWYATLRVRRVDSQHWEAIREKKLYIWACLHGRMFSPVMLHRPDRITTLVSQSRDGELVARLVDGIGHKTERGSSHRGGAAGLRAMIAAARRGPVAMMVDGPRGPREEVKPGVIALARATQLPILPVAAASSPAWTLGSWDRFDLPRPFARSWVLYGEPYHVPARAKGEEMERARLELQARLVALRERADRIAAGREQP